MKDHLCKYHVESCDEKIPFTLDEVECSKNGDLETSFGDDF